METDTGPKSLAPTFFSDLELRLRLSKTQLQDSQIQLEEVDKKNFNLSKKAFYLFIHFLRVESNVAVFFC